MNTEREAADRRIGGDKRNEPGSQHTLKSPQEQALIEWHMRYKIGEYLGAGLSVIPCNPETKRPTVAWKPYQEKPISDARQYQWPGIAIICGSVSGNLECLDFDFKAAWFDDWKALVKNEGEDILDRLLIQKTQSGGKHIVYRCAEPITGNTKLASDQGGQCYIESRGGGWILFVLPYKELFY